MRIILTEGKKSIEGDNAIYRFFGGPDCGDGIRRICEKIKELLGIDIDI